MALNLGSTETVSLQTTESDLVPIGVTGDQRRAIITLHNTDTAARTFDIYEYATGGSASQTTAVHGYQVTLTSKAYFNMDTYLLGDRKITGLADVNDKVIAKVSVLQIT